MRDLAQAAGVSLATVSRVLSGRAAVAVDKRERVLAVAQDMGYRPDPALQGLAAYRWEGRRKRVASQLALLHDEGHPALTRYRIGRIRARAREHGYGLRVFAIGNNARTEALATALAARSIRGLLVDMTRIPAAMQDFPWQNFVAVGIGMSSARLPLPLVANDRHAGMCLAWDRASACGRPGILCLPPEPQGRSRAWAAALACQQHFLQAGGQAWLHESPASPKTLADLVARYRPGVVIAGEGHYEVLHQMSTRQPPVFIALNLSPQHHGRIAGIRRNNNIVAKFAVDACIAGLRQPALPLEPGHQFLVPPHWQPGDSYPQQ